MVSVLKVFIAAERIHDWTLSTSTHREDDNVVSFHSSTHFPYAKFAPIYLELMQKFPTKIELLSAPPPPYLGNGPTRVSDSEKDIPQAPPSIGRSGICGIRPFLTHN